VRGGGQETRQQLHLFAPAGNHAHGRVGAAVDILTLDLFIVERTFCQVGLRRLADFAAPRRGLLSHALKVWPVVVRP
jgi:hypothetical protein